jgi:hypothetical protein
MKFYRATTTVPVLLSSIFGEGRHLFPTGTEVSATEPNGRGRRHLNAELEGETYDGYVDGAALEVGTVLATVNE